jgi:hypothetical protein
MMIRYRQYLERAICLELQLEGVYGVENGVCYPDEIGDVDEAIATEIELRSVRPTRRCGINHVEGHRQRQRLDGKPIGGARTYADDIGAAGNRERDRSAQLGGLRTDQIDDTLAHSCGGGDVDHEQIGVVCHGGIDAEYHVETRTVVVDREDGCTRCLHGLHVAEYAGVVIESKLKRVGTTNIV